MGCDYCIYSIKSGREIFTDDYDEERIHCPYCLDIISSQSSSMKGTRDALPAGREERRKKVRAQFADRLIKASGDGRLRCPFCEWILNATDENILRNNEHYKCHFCRHDLATVAYQQEAYHEQRWLPVIAALGDLYREKKCLECCYLAAMAKACLRAFSAMPKHDASVTHLPSEILKRRRWSVPGSLPVGS